MNIEINQSYIFIFSSLTTTNVDGLQFTAITHSHPFWYPFKLYYEEYNEGELQLVEHD